LTYEADILVTVSPGSTIGFELVRVVEDGVLVTGADTDTDGEVDVDAGGVIDIFVEQAETVVAIIRLIDNIIKPKSCLDIFSLPPFNI